MQHSYANHSDSVPPNATAKAGARTVIDGLTEAVKLPSSLPHAQGETPPSSSWLRTPTKLENFEAKINYRNDPVKYDLDASHVACDSRRCYSQTSRSELVGWLVFTEPINDSVNFKQFSSLYLLVLHLTAAKLFNFFCENKLTIACKSPFTRQIRTAAPVTVKRYYK